MGITKEWRNYYLAGALMLALLSGCGSDGGSSTASTTPVSSVTVYYGHSLAFGNSSTVMSWGYNGSGQLGDGLTVTKDAPGMVLEYGKTFRIPAGGLAMGASHSLAFFNNSTVRAWGANFSGQLGNGVFNNGEPNMVKVRNLSRVVAVAAGGNHSLALTNYSTVWSWGNNYYGQLGNNLQIGNNYTFNNYSAGQVNNAADGTPLRGISAIAAGGSHSLALRRGEVWGWGAGEYGQLGAGVALATRVPVPVATGPGNAAPLKDVKLIAAGGAFSVAVRNDDTIWAWGYNGFGQLGKDPLQLASSSTPVQVAGITGTVRAVSAGLSHVLVLTQEGATWTLWGWGDNALGQVGPLASKSSPWTPVKIGADLGWEFLASLTVDGLHPVVAVGDHSLARTSNGLWAWGNNNYNQLGYQTKAYPYYNAVPTRVGGM
jgi:alpha-tubulin suppressor-like RCC1 family protein